MARRSWVWPNSCFLFTWHSGRMGLFLRRSNFMVSVFWSGKLGRLLAAVAGVFLCAVCAANSKAQAVVEAAGATSVSAGATAGAKPVVIPKLPGATGSGTQHLIASSGPPPQEANVREFQA